MKTYGLKRRDRIICFIKKCSCGGPSSKHPSPKDVGSKKTKFKKISRRLKKSARQLAYKEAKQHE